MPDQAPETSPARDYLTQEQGVASWLFSTDHKRLALLQLAGLFGVALLAGLLALVMLLERATPALDLVDAAAFARLFTTHGTAMALLVLVPSIPATLGLFVLPLKLGAENVTFPRLALASVQLWTLGALCMLLAAARGGAATGYSMQGPLLLEQAGEAPLLLYGYSAVALSALLRAITLITTVHALRAQGLRWADTTPLTWSLYAHSVVTLVAAPVLVLTVVLAEAERQIGLGLFDPMIGGDPLLFQSFFWFGVHALLFVAVVPAVGVASEILLAFSARQERAQRGVLFGIVGLSLVALGSWGIESPTSGHGLTATAFFSLVLLLALVPAAQLVLAWLRALRSGARPESPLLLALGAIALFLIGGLSTLPLGALGLAVHLHGTAFAVGQSHLVFGSVALALLAGLHYWWPKLSGRTYAEGPARLGAALLPLGLLATFVPQLLLGALGVPRRLPSYPTALVPLYAASSLGGVLVVVGLTLLGWNLLRAATLPRAQTRAPDNPWRAPGLEWRCPSPPPAENFGAPPLTS